MVLFYWRKFLDPAVLLRVAAAFIPTGIIGFSLYKVVKQYFFNSELVVLWALALGGVALILFELLHRESDDAVAEVASGFVSSFVVAILAIKFLLAYVRTNTFIPFGIYRILIAAVFAIFVL